MQLRTSAAPSSELKIQLVVGSQFTGLVAASFMAQQECAL